MAKRFTDTDKWQKHWISQLSPNYKLFWVYLLDMVNNAGIYDVNLGLAQYLLNVELNEDHILKAFGKHIVVVKKNKWFIPKFIEFQYGDLNPANKAHLSAINKLKKYNLDTYFDQNPSGSNDSREIKDKKKSKVKSRDTKRNQLLDIKDNLKDYKEIFVNKDVSLEFDKWNDYMLSNGKTYKNYSAAFRNWLRNDFNTDSKAIEKNFKKTKTGLFIAYCQKCNKKNYPNDYQLKQSSCCGVDWSPNKL